MHSKRVLLQRLSSKQDRFRCRSASLIRFRLNQLQRGDYVGSDLRCVCSRVFCIALGLYESFGTALGGFNGIRHRRDNHGLPVRLPGLRLAKTGEILRSRHDIDRHRTDIGFLRDHRRDYQANRIVHVPRI